MKVGEISKAVAACGDPEVVAHFPAYLRRPLDSEPRGAERVWFPLVRAGGVAGLWLALRPRRGETGALDPAEVDRVYDREAAAYDWKHHITTRGQDTAWRRMAGWLVAAAPEPEPEVLDLCTGTGLTILEMARVLGEHGRRAAFTGVDYNARMLEQARARLEPLAQAGRPAALARIDATALVGDPEPGFQSFTPESFDIVTQVFGIGGVGDAMAVLYGVLEVLRPGGRFLLVDMHQPIAALPGEVPTPFGWLQSPRFEAYSYLNTTLPLALARQWGWRDTTLDFHLAPLISDDAGERCYGLRTVLRVVESERWWLGLPLMPTCRALFEKVEINRAEHERRRRILGAIGAAPA